MVKAAFDKKLLEFLYILSHSKKFLQPREMTDIMNAQGKNVSERTVRRWLHSLKRHGFKYFPYPKYDIFGLHYVYVTAWGVKNNALPLIIPYITYITEGFDFNTNSRCHMVSYIIPDGQLQKFFSFWEAAKKSGLVEDYETMQLSTPTNIYSPFHSVLDRSGGFSTASEHPPNEYFFQLLQKSAQRQPQPSLHHTVKSNPLLLPMVFEMFRNYHSLSTLSKSLRKNIGKDSIHYSRSKGLSPRQIKEALDYLHNNFDTYFNQMKVIYDPLYSGPNVTLHMILEMKPGAKLEEMTRQLHRHSLKTIIYPSADPKSRKVIVYILTSLNNLSRIFMQVIPQFVSESSKNHYIWQSFEDTKKDFWKTQDDLKPFKYHQCFDPKTKSWKYDHSAYMSALRALPKVS